MWQIRDSDMAASGRRDRPSARRHRHDQGRVHDGGAKLLGWVGDETPWQTAVTFTTPKMIEQHKATVEAFLRALKAGAKYYHDAYTGSDEKPKDGPNAAEVTGILAKYTGLTAEQVKASLAHVDAGERVDVKDIIHQVEWFQSQKMVKEDVKPASVMDSSLVVPIPGR